MKNRIAVDKAEEVAGLYGRDPFQIARRLGFRVTYDELPDGCDEMVLPEERLMFLRPEHRGNPRAARRVVAHALGHFYLHAGDQVSGSNLPHDFFVRHEQQAEAFGLTLLHGRRVGEVV